MSTNVTDNTSSHLSISPPSHPTAPPTVQITMVSDFACPWCYVAHKELHIALDKVRQTHPNTRFALEYRPYQLDPTLPGEKDKPMCRIACYRAKFGEEKMKKISAVLKERGKRVGIDLSVPSPFPCVLPFRAHLLSSRWYYSILDSLLVYPITTIEPFRSIQTTRPLLCPRCPRITC
jgi:hypothetical protein